MSGGSVTGGGAGCVNLDSNQDNITAVITGGTITSSSFGVFAQGVKKTNTVTNITTYYVVNLTIGSANGGPVISGSTAGLGVAGGSVATVKGGTISGRFGIYDVESTYDSPSRLIIDGEATVSGTSKAVRGTNKTDGTEQTTNTSDMVITISNGTYSTQVPSGYLVTDVTQIGYTKNGETVYYVDSSTDQAGRVADLIEKAGAGETVEITVTDGDLTLTNIGSTVADLHITSESTGTVSVNNTTLSNETVSFHVLTKPEAKDATCTEDGNIEYWTCSVCGKYFSDENGTTEITDTNSLTIPATGHTYGEPTFTWSEDRKSAVVGFTCEACGDIQSVIATITSEVKTAATETEAGVTVYTATVTFNGVEYTATKELADIPAAGTSAGTTPTASPANKAPTTGDESSPILWALLLTVCAVALGGALTLSRKGKEK